MRYLIRFMIPALVLVTLSASAEVYKWVDEDGQVHYGDEPPKASIEQQRLDIPSLSTDSKPANGLRPSEVRALKAIEKRKKLQKKKRKAKEKEEKKQKREAEKKAKYHRKKCKRYTLLHKRIRKQLRAGYDTKKGRRLHEKEREYADQMKEHCTQT